MLAPSIPTKRLDQQESIDTGTVSNPPAAPTHKGVYMKEFFKNTTRSIRNSAVIDIIGVNLSAFVVCLLCKGADSWQVIEVCYLTWILCYVKDTHKEILGIKKKAEI